MLSLHGKTLGVIGFGHSGRRVAELAQGPGMQVVVWSPLAANGGGRRHRRMPRGLARRTAGGGRRVSLHRPLRADTRHTLDRDALARLKPSAIVIYTSRGGLIDEEALADALEDGRLFGAGLDVLAEEPLAAGSRLASIDNVVLSPHVAGSTQEALRETARPCAAQVLDVLQNRRPASLVDPTVWARPRTFTEGKPCP